MNKFYLIILLLFLSLNFSFSFNSKWEGEVSSMDKEKIKNEIKKLNESLKKDKDNPDLIAMIGICYHNISQQEVKGAAKKAVEYLEKSLELKENPEVKAYLGSSFALKGRDELNLKLVDVGLKLIDEAYEENSEDASILIIITSVSIKIPKFMFKKRIQIIEETIDHSEKLYKDKKITDGEYSNILFLKSLYFLKINNKDDAVKTWNFIIENFPDSKYTEFSKDNLRLFTKK